MTTRAAQLAKLLVRVAITTALLVWVFSQIDLGQFREAVEMARWQYLVAVWVVTAILFWVRSVKMRVILARQGCVVPVTTLFGATTVTALYSLIVPGILSTGVKWYILRRSTGKGTNVLSSMLYNQLSTMALMTVFGLAALMVSNPTSLLVGDPAKQWLLPFVCGALLVTVLAVSLLLVSERAGGRILDLLRFLSKWLPSKMHQKSHQLLEQIAVFQTVGWRFHLTVASLTFVGTLVGGVVVYVLAARSANITVPVTVCVWLCVGIYVLGRLPISVANLGVREVTLVGFLAVYGVEKPAALLMSMILFSALIVMALIGSVFQLYWSVTARKENSTDNSEHTKG
ncbi:MAG: lysylphosphatidylglycerol synthase transmembrane domain-containing protein [Planctomycetota bacterium]|jgi:uncharacterized membrane protein YbhN (UPF0104 family)